MVNIFFDSKANLELFISGIFWIPYIIIIFFLYEEHCVRGRNLQSYILLLLLLSAIFRCLWYWLYPFYGLYTSLLAINRIAILLQFGAITLLVLMWSRALKISKWTDKEYKKLNQNNNTNNNSNNHQNQDILTNNSVSVDKTPKKYIDSLRIANENAIKKTTLDGTKHRFFVYNMIVVILNIIAWGFVLGTIGQYGFWYDFNIISISMAFAIIALVTLVVGLRISKSLHLSLLPVYISNESSAIYRQQQVGKYAVFGSYSKNIEYICECCGVYGLLMFIYNPFNISELHRLGLQMQREVLKVILTVSFCTFIFFSLRCFCFLYRPIFERDFSPTASVVLYPFFFYQIPELIPNIVIAWAISPPLGFLRVWVSRVYDIIFLIPCRQSSLFHERPTQYFEDQDIPAYNSHTNSRTNNNNKNSIDKAVDRSIASSSSSLTGHYSKSSYGPSSTSTNPILSVISNVMIDSNRNNDVFTNSTSENMSDNNISITTTVPQNSPTVKRKQFEHQQQHQNNSMRYDIDQEGWLAERQLSSEINELLYRINSMSSSSRSVSSASILQRMLRSEQEEEVITPKKEEINADVV